jgi:hypothetical protein
MKKIFWLFILNLTFTACSQNSSQEKTEIVAVDPEKAPVMSFEKESYDFGQINEGESVVYDFKFTNTGKGPLIVSNASATCGCTVPDYPKEPINPGESGNIHVVFNSTGKPGMQNKVVTLNVNTVAGTQELHLIGNVIPKKQ